MSLNRRQISLAKTKNGKARHIPLNAVASQALQERKKAQEDYRAKQKMKGTDLSDPVYVFRDGDEDPQHNYRRWFNETLTKTKIKGYSWHCNWHTFASRLVMVGGLASARTELMGHNSIQMTMRYAHLAPQHNRAAVDRLVPASLSKRLPKKGEKTGQHENGVVTKSVTSRKLVSGFESETQNKLDEINVLQQVAP